VSLLEVRDLETCYGRAQILAGVSLEVERGEVAVLLGRNGAGKSTTLKSIMGLVRPRRGEVRLAGRAITGLAPHRVARCGLGYVPEDRRVFADLTVAENLEVGRRAPRPGLPEWTPGRIYAMFPNLAELGDRPAGMISGGEQQMLAIARTLMGNPPCVLLDEPSEGLAPVILEQMAAAVATLKAEGLSVLLSEQNLRFAAAVADRAYVIEKGRIRYQGTMSELLADQAVRSAYLSV